MSIMCPDSACRKNLNSVCEDDIKDNEGLVVVLAYDKKGGLICENRIQTEVGYAVNYKSEYFVHNE